MTDEFPGLRLKRERLGKSCIPVNREGQTGAQNLLLKGWESFCTSGLSTPSQDVWSSRLRLNGPTRSLATPAIVAGLVAVYPAVTGIRSMNVWLHHTSPSFPHRMAGG